MIYQPSIPGSYAQDCLTNLSRSKEYDDKGGPENNEDENDFMSRGNRSSYHVNLPSNFYRASGGNLENAEMTACKRFIILKSELYKSMKDALQVLRQKSEVIENELIDIKLNEKSLPTYNTKKSNHPCPMQTIRKRIKWLMFKDKMKNHKTPKVD